MVKVTSILIAIILMVIILAAMLILISGNVPALKEAIDALSNAIK